MFVTSLQVVWESGTIPTQMTWMIIVLLPKGGGDYRGIGLLDPIWKVVEKVMVARLSVIKLHDCLHGGLPCRGTGTAIMEVKLQQQLAWVDQAPLYQIYLDLRKAYDALDRGRCLEILAGYGVGPNLLRLQKKFWDDAKMVCRAGGNYGLPCSSNARAFSYVAWSCCRIVLSFSTFPLSSFWMFISIEINKLSDVSCIPPHQQVGLTPQM